jgi:hypothetical protein
MEWKPIFSAPFDRDLELAVVEDDEPHILAFPCRSVHGAPDPLEVTKPKPYAFSGLQSWAAKSVVWLRPRKWLTWRQPRFPAFRLFGR